MAIPILIDPEVSTTAGGSSVGNRITSFSVSCRAKVWHYITQETGTEIDLTTKLIEFGGGSDINPILNFTYQKNMSSPYGDFYLELANNEDYSLKISTGDWIAIYLGEEGGKQSMRCFGNISRIHKKTSVSSSGMTSVTWQIAGQDFGKFFHTYRFMVNTQLLENEIFNAQVVYDGGRTQGSSSHLVKAFLQYFLQNRPEGLNVGSLRIPSLQAPQGIAEIFPIEQGDGGTPLYNILKLDIYDNSAEEEGIIFGMMDALQPLWVILKALSNTTINELFLEMTGEPGEERPTVIMRPMPFCWKTFNDGGIYNKKMRDLEFVSISYNDIMESAVGVSDVDRQNYFLIYGNILGDNVSSTMDVRAKWNPSSVARYGPIFRDFQTNYVDYGKGGKDLLVTWIDLLEHWYGNNHLLESGVMVIKGSPYTRVGKRLDVYGQYNNEKLIKRYYIEGYSDQWQFPGLWTQNLLLTRGYVTKEDTEYYVYSVEGSIKTKASIKKIKGSR